MIECATQVQFVRLGFRTEMEALQLEVQPHQIFRQPLSKIRVTWLWMLLIMNFFLRQSRANTWWPRYENVSRRGVCFLAASQMPPKHLRRSHTKSKKGCSQCKVRRIKVSYDIRTKHVPFLIRQPSATKQAQNAIIVNDARSHVILSCRKKNDELLLLREVHQHRIVIPIHLQ